MVEFWYCMEGDWVFFGRFIVVVFFGYNMQELWVFQVLYVFQCVDQIEYVMVIYWVNVVKVQFFKQCVWYYYFFDMFFGMFKQFFNWWYFGEDFFVFFVQGGVEFIGEQLCQMIVQCVDVFGN